MVLGETGVGKTTLIDAYINHLVGVDYYDKFRYRLIDERKIHAEIAKKQGKKEGEKTVTRSVTSSVTTYHIPSGWIKRGLF